MSVLDTENLGLVARSEEKLTPDRFSSLHRDTPLDRHFASCAEIETENTAAASSYES